MVPKPPSKSYLYNEELYYSKSIKNLVEDDPLKST